MNKTDRYLIEDRRLAIDRQIFRINEKFNALIDYLNLELKIREPGIYFEKKEK